MSCLTSDLFLKVTRLIWSLLFRPVSNWFSLPSFALMTQRYNVKYRRFKIQLPWWPSGLRLHSWTTLLKPHSCTRRRRSGNWLPHPEAKMQSVLKLRSTRTEVRGQRSPSADLWLITAAGSLSVCSALWTENSEWEQAERKDTNHVSINTERAWTPAASVTGGVQSHFLSLVGPVSTV